MRTRVRSFLDSLSESFKAANRGVSYHEKRGNRKYQYSDGDMITRFVKRWPKPFPAQTMRNGTWTDNK